jgi:hypothetical protein
MKDEYTTNQPWIYALAMLSIFLITAMVFFLYNYYVEHRQKLVLTTAEKSSTLVSALFPKTVRDRVLQEAHEKTKKGTKSNISFLARDRQGNLDLGLPLEEGHPATPIIGMLLTRLRRWLPNPQHLSMFDLLVSLSVCNESATRS